jgi:hypothetical protein
VMWEAGQDEMPQPFNHNMLSGDQAPEIQWK